MTRRFPSPPDHKTTPIAPLMVSQQPTRDQARHRAARLASTGHAASAIVCTTDLQASTYARVYPTQLELGAVVQTSERTIRAGGMAITLWIITATMPLTAAERAGTTADSQDADDCDLRTPPLSLVKTTHQHPRTATAPRTAQEPHDAHAARP
ncbi:MAG TPA: hypothetical protein VNW46_19195 [Gemmatimonadaceae bacterium]|jgi:hypothetical protein|nr:hypothetical protein [Gemmatimonadaceae bacterium]